MSYYDPTTAVVPNGEMATNMRSLLDDLNRVSNEIDTLADRLIDELIRSNGLSEPPHANNIPVEAPRTQLEKLMFLRERLVKISNKLLDLSENVGVNL